MDNIAEILRFFYVRRNVKFDKNIGEYRKILGKNKFLRNMLDKIKKAGCPAPTYLSSRNWTK